MRPLRRLAACLAAIMLTACAGNVSPTPTASITPTFTASASATETATPGPTDTATPRPTRDPNITPVAIIPCLLINAIEAASVLGEPVAEPVPTEGGCVYFDSAAGQYALSYFALPPEYAGQAIRGHALVLGSFGAQVTTARADELVALGELGDMPGVIDGLSALVEGATSFSYLNEAIGDGGLWVSKEHSFVRQGMLLVARKEALIGIDLLVTNARDETSVRDSARNIISQLLERLPEHFTLLDSASPATPTLPATIPPTLLTPAATPIPGTTIPASPTVAVTRTVAATPTAKPPAFSVPILASDTLFYDGTCGSNLQTVTVTVVDPSGVNPITNVSVVVRLVGSSAGASGGATTEWRALPMRAEGGGVWLRTLVVEQDLPGYEQFASANVEFYFLATNRAGISAESAHYGIDEVPLKLVACPS